MANTKISALPANTTPSGSEEMVYASNNANGKMTLDTMKWYVESNLNWYATTSDLTTWLAWKQDTLVSWTNIRTINGASVMWSWDIIVTWWTWYTAWTGIDITGWVISATWWVWWQDIYDAIVDASGNGDYTTIWAAVAAGKYNLYIKNWNYTEEAALDVSTWWYLSLIWESRDWVVVTIPNTVVPVSGAFIKMWGSEKYLYIYNIKFNITFNSDMYYFCLSGWNKFDIRIEDCDFVYSSSFSSRRYLFYCNNCIEIGTGSDLQEICPKYPWNWVYWCTFYTESSSPNRVEIFLDWWYFDSCSFTTWASAWEICHSSYWIYNNCYFDVFQLDWGWHMFINSIVKVKSWWLVEYSRSGSQPNSLDIRRLSHSSLSIEWTLWTSPSDWLKIWWLVEYSSIKINDATATVRLWWETYWNNVRRTSDSVIDLSSNTINISNSIYNTKVRNCWTLTFNNSTYSQICNSYFETNTVTIQRYESSILWNIFDWTWTRTITLSGDDSTYLWNVWRWFTVTDSWTWNVKDNNIV